MRLKAVFFDYGGVFSKSRFYSTLPPEYSNVSKYIDDDLFGGDRQLVDNWMRGEFTYRDVNRIIATATGINLEELNELFLQSIRMMNLNIQLIEFAKQLKDKGVPTAIVTDNMDIFNELTVPEKRLDKFFTKIINSYDYKILKCDENGKLFDIAIAKLGLNSYDGVLLIDDSENNCRIFEGKGGIAHRYNNFEALEKYYTETFPM
jgi:FMN phosphatase YigB (HAD superfamily)